MVIQPRMSARMCKRSAMNFAIDGASRRDRRMPSLFDLDQGGGA
jgi:hypothetical protein